MDQFFLDEINKPGSNLKLERFKIMTQNPFKSMSEEEWQEYSQRSMWFSEEPHYESDTWDKIKGFEQNALKWGFKLLYKSTYNNSQFVYVDDKCHIDSNYECHDKYWYQRTFWCFNYPGDQFYLYISYGSTNCSDDVLEIKLVMNSSLFIPQIENIMGIEEKKQKSLCRNDYSDSSHVIVPIIIPGCNIHEIGSGTSLYDSFAIEYELTKFGESINFDDSFFAALKYISSYAHKGFYVVDIPNVVYDRNITLSICSWVLKYNFYAKYEGKLAFRQPHGHISHDIPLEKRKPIPSHLSHYQRDKKQYRISESDKIQCLSRSPFFIQSHDNRHVTINPFAQKVIESFIDFLSDLLTS